jgi:hypothetical protein
MKKARSAQSPERMSARCQFPVKIGFVAVALALAAGSNAYAFNPTTTATINPVAAVDGVIDGQAVQGGTFASGGAFAIDKYSGGGVLTGASFNAALQSKNLSFSWSGPSDSSTLQGQAWGTARIRFGANVLGTSSGTAVGSGSVTFSTSTTRPLDAYSVQGSAGVGQLGLFYSATPATVAGYVEEALNVNLASRSGGTTGNLQVDNVPNKTATVTATYTALDHANGSFGSDTIDNNTLNVDFGNVVLGNTPAPSYFLLYDLATSYGLQVLSVTGSGGIFSQNVSTGITQLTTGNAFPGTVSMAPVFAPGNYEGHWTITVADTSAPIFAVGQQYTTTDTLYINAYANVLSAVPEPETYAMILAGLGLIGFVARRRKQRPA